MKVLACDGIHEDGLALFREAGWDVEVSEPIKDPALLARALDGVDALLVRSSTQVTAEAIANAKQLKVIGRAGAGVDTIDVEAATEKGIAVMNAPDGKTLATRDSKTDATPVRPFRVTLMAFAGIDGPRAPFFGWRLMGASSRARPACPRAPSPWPQGGERLHPQRPPAPA